MSTYVFLCFSQLFTGRKSIKTMPEKRVGICLPQKTWQERGTAACIVYNSSELGKSVDELSFVPQIFIALSKPGYKFNDTCACHGGEWKEWKAVPAQILRIRHGAVGLCVSS